MTDELKSTQVCYGEDVLMMRVDDCIIFGNKDALQKIIEKIERQTAKVKANWHPCGISGVCLSCGGDVYNDDPYCSHCGAKLDWGNDE